MTRGKGGRSGDDNTRRDHRGQQDRRCDLDRRKGLRRAEGVPAGSRHGVHRRGGGRRPAHYEVGGADRGDLPADDRAAGRLRQAQGHAREGGHRYVILSDLMDFDRRSRWGRGGGGVARRGQEARFPYHGGGDRGARAKSHCLHSRRYLSSGYDAVIRESKYDMILFCRKGDRMSSIEPASQGCQASPGITDEDVVAAMRSMIRTSSDLRASGLPLGSTAAAGSSSSSTSTTKGRISFSRSTA